MCVGACACVCKLWSVEELLGMWFASHPHLRILESVRKARHHPPIESARGQINLYGQSKLAYAASMAPKRKASATKAEPAKKTVKTEPKAKTEARETGKRMMGR